MDSHGNKDAIRAQDWSSGRSTVKERLQTQTDVWAESRCYEAKYKIVEKLACQHNWEMRKYKILYTFSLVSPLLSQNLQLLWRDAIWKDGKSLLKY